MYKKRYLVKAGFLRGQVDFVIGEGWGLEKIVADRILEDLEYQGYWGEILENEFVYGTVENHG